MKTYLSLCLLLLTAGYLTAQDFVADINRGNNGSTPGRVSTSERYAAWAATNAAGDRLIYYTDENNGETTAIQLPAPRGQSVRAVAAVGNRAYVQTETPNRLGLVYAINLADGQIENLEVTVDLEEDFLLPLAYGDEAILTLPLTDSLIIYRTDGTTAGTQELIKLAIRTGSRQVVSAIVGDYLYLSRSATDGERLVSIDLRDGTAEVLRQGAPLTTRDNTLLGAGDRLYFGSADGGLYVSEGTVATTRLLRELPQRRPGLNVVPVLYAYRDSVIAITDADEVYVVDPVTDSVRLRYAFDLEDRLQRTSFVPGENYAYFLVSNDFSDDALFRTDFTDAGTVRLAPDVQFRYGYRGEYSSPRILPDERFYFLGPRRQLNVVDAAGIVRPAYTAGTDRPSRADDGLAITASAAYLSGPTLTVGQEVFRVAQTDVTLTVDANNSEAGSEPLFAYDLGGRLTFFATSECTGREPYALIPGDSTRLLGDLIPGPGHGLGTQPARAGEALYFLDRTPTGIFRTDGTIPGTERVWTFDPGVVIASVPGRAGGNIYFTIRDGGNVLLYEYDTDSSDVNVLSATVSGLQTSPAAAPTGLGDTAILHFLSSGNDNAGLYLTDLQTGNTEYLLDLEDQYSSFIHFGDEVYFLAPARDVGSGTMLFRTDGTPEGSTPAFADPNFLLSVQFNSPVVVGDYFYYVSNLFNPFRQQLYRFRAGDAAPEAVNGADGLLDNFSSFYAHGPDSLFFTAATPTGGSEPYLVTNADATARRVIDLVPGENGSKPSNYFTYRNRVYFSAFHPATGRELYRTDGTAGGTELLFDLHPGVGDARPVPLIDFNGVLYFRADEGLTGSELWRYDPDGTGMNNSPDAVAGLCPVGTPTHGPTPNEEVRVYPNPASVITTVELPAGRYALELTDARGRLLRRTSGRSERAEMNVSDLPAGAYYLRVTHETDGRRRTVPIAVQR